ncbi:alpha/beta hydrolase [Actinomycetaceae bacterium TAE3-ERU4]|nr:alpha/beta hydrolase [Actinomycetaceae bacterium TAE3-ERU4]
MAERHRYMAPIPARRTYLRKYCGSLVKITYQSAVQGKVPFLLVHGLGVSSQYFQRLSQELQASAPVITVDLPGFGGLPAPPKSNISYFSEIIAQVCREFAPAGAHVVGHSMGAQIALEHAARYPQASLSLIGLPERLSSFPKTRLMARFIRSSWHEPAGLIVIALKAYLQCGVLNFLKVAPQVANYRAEDTSKRIEKNNIRLIRGGYDYVSPTNWNARISQALRANNNQVSTAVCPEQAHSVLYQADEWLATMITDCARLPGPSLSQRLQASSEGDERQSSGYLTRINTVIREIFSDFKEKIYALRFPHSPKEWEKGNKIRVVLLPGVNESWQALRKIAENLNKHGHPISVIPKLGMSISEPEELAAIVQKELTEQQIKSCIFVAHSKGGLVAQSLLQSREEPRDIKAVITIATPYGGSPWGYLFPKKSRIGRLAPTADFFKRIRKLKTPSEIFHVISPSWDPKVIISSTLPGARHYRLPGCGHNLPLNSQTLIDLVSEIANEVEKKDKT